MRRLLLIGFVVVNAGLALALFGSPAQTQIMASSLFRDCCQELEGDFYCCDECCWFVNDCDFSADCEQ